MIRPRSQKTPQQKAKAARANLINFYLGEADAYDGNLVSFLITWALHYNYFNNGYRMPGEDAERANKLVNGQQTHLTKCVWPL